MRILTVNALENLTTVVRRTNPQGVKYKTNRVLIHPDHIDCTRLHIYDPVNDYGVIISEEIGFVRIELSRLSDPIGKRGRRDLHGLSDRVTLKPEGVSEGLSPIAESIYKCLTDTPLDAQALAHLIASIYPGKFNHFTELKFKTVKDNKTFEYVGGKLVPTKELPQ